MAQVNAYVRERIQYNESRRNSTPEIEKELEEKVFEPEYYEIVILGRPVHTVYTNSRRCVRRWISLVKQRYNSAFPRTVGLDIQLLEDSQLYLPLSTIQLCISNECLIYHMYNSYKLPKRLQRFLTDPRNIFVGFCTQYELIVLKYWTQFTGRINYRDLTRLAFPDGVPRGTGAREVTARVLRQDLVLPEMDQDWDFHTLTDEQIIYACAYAYLPYRCAGAPFPVA